jgi:hypothetical protein
LPEPPVVARVSRNEERLQRRVEELEAQLRNSSQHSLHLDQEVGISTITQSISFSNNESTKPTESPVQKQKGKSRIQKEPPPPTKKFKDILVYYFGENYLEKKQDIEVDKIKTGKILVSCCPTISHLM